MRRFLPPFLFVLLAFSCQKQPGPPEISLSRESLSLESAAGSGTVDLTVNRPWTATTDAPWCKVIPASGNGFEGLPGDLHVVCEENPGHAERSCTVTVRSADLSKTLTVTQDHREGMILDRQEYVLSPDAQTIDLQIWTTVPVTVEIGQECREWISWRKTKAMQDPGIQIEVRENKSVSREGTVHLYAGNEAFDISVRQGPGYIHFSDPVFRETCLSYFDWDQDGILTMDEAILVNSMQLPAGIKSLDGLECFTELGYLYIEGLLADKLDVSALTHLHTLYVSGPVKELRLGNGSSLMHLDLNSSEMTQLDLSGLANLQWLNLYGLAALSDLKLSGSASLTEAYIQFCGIDRLDVSHCPALQLLSLLGNDRLDKVHLGDQPSLWNLDCAEMPISTLDISGCTALRNLSFRDVAIQEFDLRGNDCLTSFSLSSIPQLETIRINSCPLLYSFGCSACANLKSLEINDCPELSGMYFEMCYVSAISMRNLPNLFTLYLWGIECHSFSLSGSTQLQSLNCSYNHLEELTVFDCPSLTELVCSGNSLTSLSMIDLPGLRILHCNDNLLAELACSRFPLLNTLNCNKNQLKELDLSDNPELDILTCYNNPLLKEVILIKGKEYSTVGYDPDTTTIVYE